MIHINWDPTPYFGPIPINWYGLNFVLAFVVAGLLVRKWAPRWGFSKAQIESLLASILIGIVIGARLYFVVQNDFAGYLIHPWRIAALWEGGLAFFGGLAGGILAAYLYARSTAFRSCVLVTYLHRLSPSVGLSGALAVGSMEWITVRRHRCPGALYMRIRTASRRLTESAAIRISSTSFLAT